MNIYSMNMLILITGLEGSVEINKYTNTQYIYIYMDTCNSKLIPHYMVFFNSVVFFCMKIS